MLACVLVALAVLTGRLVYLQVLAGPQIAAAAHAARLTSVEIPADRGAILDTDGVALAESVERWDVVANPLQIAQSPTMTTAKVAEQAEVLAGLLGQPAAEIGARLVATDEDGDPRQWVLLARGVVPDVRTRVLEAGLVGISTERTTERVYPSGRTAGNLLGFVGADGKGQAGLEMTYDELLSGTPGEMTYERGALGQRIPGGERSEEPAVDGHDLVLTIQRDLQYASQVAIDAKVAESGAQWGAVEIVNARTGEILALADSGSVDPNDPGATPAERRGSRAVEVVYEPGSTAKVVAMAAVLEEGVASPTDRFVVPDTYDLPNIGSKPFKDSHPHPDLNLTLAGILAQSSNTGTVMVGKELPRQVRHDYLRRFGFGERTGVGLPAESAGLLADAEDWDGRSEYAVLFGQAVSVTTLQATQVFQTVANGGVRVQPHLVKGTVDPDGDFQPVELAEPRRVISEETAQTLMTMLEGAVAEGTGKAAQVPGYRVAGKTGTAQAFEAGGTVKHVASFIGVAPADDPRIVVNVVLYDPKTSIYGGDVAAPVFSEVAEHALRQLGVPPSSSEPTLFPTTWQ